MTRVNTQSRFIEMFQDITSKRSLCEISRPRQWPTIPTKDFTNSGYLVYGANGVIGYYSEYNHEHPTILIACRGASCGAINISAPKSYITGNAMCLDELSEDMVFDYLAYYLRIYNYSGIITGGAQPQITYSSLKKVLVPIPDKSLQEQFSDINRQADKSKFIFKSRFFFQFDKLPFSHKWKDVLTITNGKAYGEEYKDAGTYPICGSGGIMGYGEKKMCNHDTIILGRKGNIDKPIYMSEDYWIVDTAFCLCPKTEFVHPVYLYYWCKQFDFQKLNKQAVLPSLTRSDLEQIDIQVPEMTEQLEFVEIVRQADKSKYLS